MNDYHHHHRDPWSRAQANDAPTGGLDMSPRAIIARHQAIEVCKRRGLVGESLAQRFRKAVEQAESKGLVSHPERK